MVDVDMDKDVDCGQWAVDVMGMDMEMDRPAAQDP